MITWSPFCSVIFLLAYAYRARTRPWQRISLKRLAVMLFIGLFDAAGLVGYDIGTSQSATSIVATLSSTWTLIPTQLSIIVYRE